MTDHHAGFAGSADAVDDQQVAAVRRYLQGLPMAQPPAALGARLLRRHRLRQQRPLWLAAAALVVLALLLPALPGPQIPPRHHAQALQADALREIRALDRELQSAYLQAHGGAPVDALWQARAAAVANIENPQSAAPRPVRL
jgi:hypothetical protein